MKEKIINKFKKKIKILKKNNKNYFEDDNPKISDAEYDSLKKEIIDLENKHSFLKNIDTIKNLIGTPPSNKFKKIKHLKPMLSLANAFGENDMRDFIKKIVNFLNLKNQRVELFCEPKIDGISATLVYENGILVRGLSRGDGILVRIF